ncbi:hypothetical protein H072_8610 [Dactylellina haptotyla CBS 200.50]|uniref:Telomeric single stranded DNA binding POT1/Cdc13 domain-containing protein n=1 Tax=Dactylellina haptotyla (strain CBS 200.50) TaxID=1284197 RepID=S8A9J2_DACHA|nr:hypothetical protein H072_8610 [Dactylellina haptotyla CBS 200.50]
MASLPDLSALQPIPLSSLDPSATPTGEITATVAALWPYSSSALKLTAIIAEPDHLKREQRGELKVSFHGYAAEALKNLTIGDVVKVSLEGVEWEALPAAEEKDVPWQLRWEKRLRAKVFQSGSTKPYVDIDKSFNQARRSGVFERIAAAEAIISQSQLEEDDDIELHTPLKKNSQLSAGSWSTSFRGAEAPSQTPLNIFAQGKRQLFSLDSDEEDEELDAERATKKPRFFEPSQSFRYVSDSPGDEEQPESETLQRTEDQFFDENSFRESLRESGSRMYIRPDEPGDTSAGDQSFRTVLGDKTQSSKLFVRPDNTQTSTQGTLSQGTILGQEMNTRPREPDSSTADDIFQIIFGQPPGKYTPESQQLTNETATLGRSVLPSQESETSTKTPLATKEVSPLLSSAARSTSPPGPGPLQPVDLDSQPMSSFALDLSQSSLATHRPTSIEMPPPPFQPKRFPQLDLSTSEHINPLTPTLKPAPSPVLPLPSPFPTSSLDKGSVFFPSQLSQSFTSSGEESDGVESSAEGLASIPATAKAVLERMEVRKQERTIDSAGSETIEESIEIKHETITVVEHASSPIYHGTPESSHIADAEDAALDSENEEGEDGEEEEEEGEEERSSEYSQSQTQSIANQEIIEILDSSDEEGDVEARAYEDKEEGEDEEDEFEYVDPASHSRQNEMEAEYNDEEEASFEAEEQVAVEEEDDDDDEDEGYPEKGAYDDEEEEEDDETEYRYDKDRRTRDDIEFDELEEFEFENIAKSPQVSEEEPDTDNEYLKVGKSPVSSHRSASQMTKRSSRTRADQSPDIFSSLSPVQKLPPQSSGLRGTVFSRIPGYHSSSDSRSSSPLPHHNKPSRIPWPEILVLPPADQIPQTPHTPGNNYVHTLEDNGFEIVGSSNEGRRPKFADLSGAGNPKVPGRPKKHRLLPWMTPQPVPNKVPSSATRILHTDPVVFPTSSPKRHATPMAKVIEIGRRQRKLFEERLAAAHHPPVTTAGPGPIYESPPLETEVEGEPEEIRRFRRYNRSSRVTGGVVTSFSEFVPLDVLHRLTWAAQVDLFAVNLREAEVEQLPKKPKFFQLKFTIIDPSCIDGRSSTISLIRPYQIALPAKVKPGDILLLRNIQIKSIDGQRAGFSTMSSSWVVWRPRRRADGTQEMAIVPDEGPPTEFGAEEVEYVNQLWEWWKGIDVDLRVYLINRREEVNTEDQ